MSRQVEREGIATERDDDAVPRVGVLSAAVEEDELGRTAPPADGAQRLAAGECQLFPSRAERSGPVDAHLGGVLGNEGEFVVWLGVIRGG